MSNPDYEKHFSKAQQVLQELRKLHSSENVLDKLCRGSTTKVELRGNIELLLQQQGINFDKQTYDCLSSYLDYNCRGEICQTQLRKFLVEETDKEAMERFERRVRAEPGEHKPTTNRVDEKQALQSL